MASYTWSYLLNKYLDNTISKSELLELLYMVEEEKEYPELAATLKRYWQQSAETVPGDKVNWDAGFYVMMEKEAQEVTVTHAGKKNSGKWIYRFSIAATIVLALATGYYFFASSPIAVETTPQAIISKDVAAPGSNNAVLTLSNGQKIVLDTTAAGLLATQGTTVIQKGKEGEIIYRGDGGSTLQYNTLTVPRGSKIAGITLSDGTKVWLNAGSSLRYPVSFKKEERTVEIVGEAYFEVMPLHHKSRPTKIPFVVKTNLASGNNGEIEVLGTHFNVNAYEDEQDIKVTLLEGAVKVNNSLMSKVLKPGEQASMIRKIDVANEIDIEEVMAWKNGKFQFGEASDINAIMREISRWYDLDIVYQDPVKGHIGGTISRNQNVSKVLNMLEMTGAVKFTIEGRKVIVKSE